MAVAQVASSRAGQVVLYITLIVALLALTSLCFTAAWAGWRRAGTAAAAGFTLGLLAEWAGTRTGFPFGGYRYTGLLHPSAATVPLVVPLAWAAMGLPSYRVGCGIGRGRAGRVLAGAVALTAWDLFLDPQMLQAGAWHWDHPGPYHGVPLTNFAGWLLVSVLLMVLFEAALGPKRRRRDRGLLATYTVLGVMETVGFAAVFPDGRAVAVAGAVGMAVPAALAWAGTRRVRPHA